MIPKAVLDSAQKIILEVMQASVFSGKIARLPHKFIVNDSQDGRFVFMTGILSNTKFPSWFRHIELSKVWIPKQKVGQYLEYTVFSLTLLKVTVRCDDGGFWIDGLYSEPCWVSAYCTYKSRSFWGSHPYSEEVIDFMSQYFTLS